jgi:AraC-like DNA-binding protein
MAEFSDAGLMLKLAARALEKQGLSVAEVFSRVHLSSPRWDDPQWRTPHKAQGRFWEVVEELSGDEFIGLHLAESMPVFRGQVLEYLFLSSQTFGEGLKRAINYQRLLSDAMSMDMDEAQHTAFLNIRLANNQRQSLHHFNDCLMLNIINFFKWASDGKFRPLKVHFTHAEPDIKSEYLRLFNCALAFNAPVNRIEFDRDLLKVRSLHAEPDLLQLHERCAHEQMTRLDRQVLVQQVQAMIAEMLDSGDVSIERIAERIGISSRHLRRRLDEQGTSFNSLLAQHRCELAKRLLTETRESIDEIVFLTGFSEPSTFYRAFKRWTGMTPLAFRNQKKTNSVLPENV